MPEQPGLLKGNSFQAWRTPKHLFEVWDAEYGFDLDAAADADNALCTRFLTEEFSAFKVPWSVVDQEGVLKPGSVWLNPPYNDCESWVKKAENEVILGRATRVVMLLPASISTRWFLDCVKYGEVHLFHGRIQFELPPGVENKNRSSLSNILVIFEKTGLRGVTAIRSARTGHIIWDMTEPVPDSGEVPHGVEQG